MSPIEFIRESNRIEGIRRAPTQAEIKAHVEFWALERVSLADVEKLVKVLANAALRRYKGMDVRVGTHIPPRGGLMVVTAERDALRRAFNRLDAAVTHHRKAHMPEGVCFADTPDEALWHARDKVVVTMGLGMGSNAGVATAKSEEGS